MRSFCWRRARSVLDPEAWTWPKLAWLTLVALLLVLGSFVVLAQFFAPPKAHLCTGACEGRPIHSGAGEVSATRVRLDRAAWLTQGALARLLAVLDRDGEEARVVGGAVRNALIGEPPGDVDVATTALPDEVIRRTQAAGFKAVPTGIEHGTSPW